MHDAFTNLTGIDIVNYASCFQVNSIQFGKALSGEFLAFKDYRYRRLGIPILIPLNHGKQRNIRRSELNQIQSTI
ncbi:MAG: hypothetical protein D4R64_09100 [Porphyromonadaceae bacterium]|nr:MAG: hypothetical protein D4R64_09100 [Porphyromonadaceae bacterium]